MRVALWGRPVSTRRSMPGSRLLKAGRGILAGAAALLHTPDPLCCPLLPPLCGLPCCRRCCSPLLPASQGSAWQKRVAAALQQAAEDPAAAGRQYLAVAATQHHSRAGGPDAVLLLGREANESDLLEGYCAALMLAWAARLPQQAAAWPAAAQRALADVDSWLAGGRQQQASGSPAQGTRSRTRSSGAGGSGRGSGGFAAFASALSAAGWALDRVALLQGPARLAWGPADLHSH